MAVESHDGRSDHVFVIHSRHEIRKHIIWSYHSMYKKSTARNGNIKYFYHMFEYYVLTKKRARWKIGIYIVKKWVKINNITRTKLTLIKIKVKLDQVEKKQCIYTIMSILYKSEQHKTKSEIYLLQWNRSLHPYQLQYLLQSIKNIIRLRSLEVQVLFICMDHHIVKCWLC